MKPLIDAHTHTIASGHAYSTLQENIAQAKAKGLKYYGVTDHGPKMFGSCSWIYFANLGVVPSVIDGVHILKGCELNIMDDYTLDLNERQLSRLDYCIASMHFGCWDTAHTQEENMKAYQMALDNPHVLIIGHPDDGRYSCDFDQLIKMIKEKGKLVEINNSSLRPGGIRENAHENIPLILEACKKYQQPVILDSDAHVSYDVGGFGEDLKILEKCTFPDDLVVNYSEELIKKYFKIEND